MEKVKIQGPSPRGAGMCYFSASSFKIKKLLFVLGQRGEIIFY